MSALVTCFSGGCGLTFAESPGVVDVMLAHAAHTFPLEAPLCEDVAACFGELHAHRGCPWWGYVQICADCPLFSCCQSRCGMIQRCTSRSPDVLPAVQPPPLNTLVMSCCVLRHPAVLSRNLSLFCLSLCGSFCKTMMNNQASLM